MAEFKKRLDYVDFMRGITMILVVYSHVDISVLGNEPISEINRICMLFRMPLFFFISGFFIYSDNYSFELLKKRTFNRFIRQLYPTLLIMYLFTSFVGINYVDSLFEFYKAGYWFTFTAFELFLLVAPLLFLINSKGRKFKLTVIVAAVILNVGLFFLTHRLGIQGRTWNLLGVDHVFNYMPYLLMGVLCRMFIQRYTQIVKSKLLGCSV